MSLSYYDRSYKAGAERGGGDEYAAARRDFERHRRPYGGYSANEPNPSFSGWNVRSSKSTGRVNAPLPHSTGADIPTKSDDPPESSLRWPSSEGRIMSTSHSDQMSVHKSGGDAGDNRSMYRRNARHSSGQYSALDASSEAASTRLEELSSREQFERARQSRISFQKMGKLFGGMVTRFLGIEDGKINYYDKRTSKKRRGTYVFGPGARVEILDASMMDPEESEGLKPGTCWLRVQGLRRANGQEHTPILILTKNEDEALLWKGAIEYSRLMARQSGREDVHEDEADTAQTQNRSFKNADDLRRERASAVKKAEANMRKELKGKEVAGSSSFVDHSKQDNAEPMHKTNTNSDKTMNYSRAADTSTSRKEQKKQSREERREARRTAKEAKKRKRKAKKALRAAAYLKRKNSMGEKNEFSNRHEESSSESSGRDQLEDDNIDLDESSNHASPESYAAGHVKEAKTHSSRNGDGKQRAYNQRNAGHLDPTRRLGKQDTTFYHRSILQITRHLQRRHHIIQAEVRAKEAERDREEGELLNETERERRRQHAKSLKLRNKNKKAPDSGLPADLFLPLDVDAGVENDLILLRRAQSRRTGLSRRDVAVLEMEQVLFSFVEFKQPNLNQFDDRVLARTVVHTLSLLPQPLLPPEVWSIYKRSWEYSLEEARRREMVARQGYVLPEQLITRERRVEMASELVEMLPMSNVRLIREVLGVVRVLCKTHRPWEIGKRNYIATDDTTNNLTPQFGQILLRGRFERAGSKAWLADSSSGGDDFVDRTPATSLVKILLKHFRKIFGILTHEESSSDEDREVDRSASAVVEIDTFENLDDSASKPSDKHQIGARDRKRSILKKKSSFAEKESPNRSFSPRIQFADDLEQVRLIPAHSEPFEAEDNLMSNGQNTTKDLGGDNILSGQSSDIKVGSMNGDSDFQAENVSIFDENQEEVTEERDSNEWVDALEDRASINRTIESLSRLIVRYRTKIVQNGPYIKKSSSVEDKETMADWRKRVKISEQQLQKLRERLDRMDAAAIIFDEEHLDETQKDLNIETLQAARTGDVSDSSEETVDDVIYKRSALLEIPNDKETLDEKNLSADEFSHKTKNSSKEVTQEQEILMQTAERIKHIWLQAQTTELHKKSTSDQTGGNISKEHPSHHDLEEELRSGASKLQELSAEISRVNDAVTLREKHIGHPNWVSASKVALNAATESTGMLRGYLPSLSIPYVSSFTGWIPRFASTADADRQEENKGGPVGKQDDKLNDASSRSVDDVGAYVGLQRLLVELISENVKMRTQLNHYSEALLMPALEKDKEFRRQFHSSETVEGTDSQVKEALPDKSEDQIVSIDASETSAFESDVSHYQRKFQDVSGMRKAKCSNDDESESSLTKSHDRKAKEVNRARHIDREKRRLPDVQSDARLEAIRKRMKEEEERLLIVLMREEAEKKRSMEEAASLTSSDDELSDE